MIYGNGKILVVDDEQLIRTTVKSMLEKLGYDVIQAENGEEAINIYQEQQDDIDLVILDMIMPVMNGRDTFFKLREIDKNCRVIVASGFSRDNDLIELLQNGLMDSVVKPYHISQLSNKVAAALGIKD